jgi:hypothetical protein
MLNDLIKINDELPFNPDKLTRFHSRSAPGISVQDYLMRICRFCPVENAILLAVVYFIDLLSTHYPDFVVNSLTVHRFLIAAVMVGSKGLCDSFCTNSHYARVGGIPRVELNLLEVEFLTRVGYRIVPKHELLDQYYQRMVARTQGTYIFAEECAVPSPVTPASLASTPGSAIVSPPPSAGGPGEKSRSTTPGGRHHHHVRDAIRGAFSKLITPSDSAKEEHLRQMTTALKRREPVTGDEQRERTDPKTPTTPKRPRPMY